MTPPRRPTLPATLCHVRQAEITDSPVDLVIQLVLKTDTRAGPSGTVRRVIFPVMGGEKTFKALEPKCNNTAYRPVMDAIGLLKRYLEQPLEEGAFFGTRWPPTQNARLGNPGRAPA